MALNKKKLEDVSYTNGFSVLHLEAMELQLRETLNALHKKNYSSALASANAIQARIVSLVAQIERRIK